MISLASEMTDSKGRHARGWLFFDAECDFCAGIANSLMGPMKRRGLAVAHLQDPRVGSLLGLSQEERLRAICFVRSNDSRRCRYSFENAPLRGFAHIHHSDACVIGRLRDDVIATPLVHLDVRAALCPGAEFEEIGIVRRDRFDGSQQ